MHNHSELVACCVLLGGGVGHVAKGLYLFLNQPLAAEEKHS